MLELVFAITEKGLDTLRDDLQQGVKKEEPKAFKKSTKEEEKAASLSVQMKWKKGNEA